MELMGQTLSPTLGNKENKSGEGNTRVPGSWDSRPWEMPKPYTIPEDANSGVGPDPHLLHRVHMPREVVEGQGAPHVHQSSCTHKDVLDQDPGPSLLLPTPEANMDSGLYRQIFTVFQGICLSATGQTLAVGQKPTKSLACWLEDLDLQSRGSILACYCAPSCTSAEFSVQVLELQEASSWKATRHEISWPWQLQITKEDEPHARTSEPPHASHK